MSTFLVTGAAGFIGSHLTDSLLKLGHTVKGIDLFTPYYPHILKERNISDALANPSFSLASGDIVDSSFDELAEDVDGIFHLAAQPGVRGSWGTSFEIYLRDNLLATQKICECALQRGTRVVYASSSSVYGDAESYPTPEATRPRPISPYGVTKLSCEHLADAYSFIGLDAIGLRYFTVYGPRQRPDMAFTRIANALLTNHKFDVFGTGDQSRDVTYVGDAVSATMAAMEKGRSGAIYNVGGGSELSLNHAISLFEQMAGHRLTVQRDVAARGDVRRTASDTKRLTGDVGWMPSTSIEQGIANQLAWARREEADEIFSQPSRSVHGHGV